LERGSNSLERVIFASTASVPRRYGISIHDVAAMKNLVVIGVLAVLVSFAVPATSSQSRGFARAAVGVFSDGTLEGLHYLRQQLA
jgi:hypothetical protein